MMRGEVDPQPTMLSYVDPESRLPKQHPIRKIRNIVVEALLEVEPAFERMYSDNGRRSIPPEQLARALLLQTFFTIVSEIRLMARIDCDWPRVMLIAANCREPGYFSQGGKRVVILPSLKNE